MTRGIAVIMLALVACGNDDNRNDSDSVDGSTNPPPGLACNALSYCSTWTADSTSIAAPVERGGAIADGIYRLERGTFSVELLQFAGNQINVMDDSFMNQSGTYTTANGKISFTYTKRCDGAGTADDTLSWNDRPYYANGDTLLIGMADSGSTVVWYEYKRIPLDQICTPNANVECRVTNCSCAVVTNGFGTVTSGIKQCSSS